MSAISTAEAGAWVAGLGWDDLPAEVRERAATTLLNDLGAMIGGLPTPAARIAARYAEAEGEGGGFVLGSARRRPYAAAAFANGVAGSTLDVDGGHYLGGGIHPGPAVGGALVTLLEQDGAGGDDLLVALVAGYEVAIRLGYLLWPEDRSGQAHTSGTAAAMGAAAAAARLLGLPPEAATRALEIAWAHAPMSALQFPMVKESLGWAAATGVSAARLAALGFKEQPGHGRPFAADVFPPTPLDRGRDDPFVGGLGRDWRLLEVYFKPYASCRYTHAAADAALALRERHGLTADDVERVAVVTHVNATFLDDQAPDTDDGAQYSFPYVVAAVLRDGRFGAEHLDPDALDDPERGALAARVTVEHDPALDDGFPLSYPAGVRIVTRDGRELVEIRRGASGDVADPLDRSTLHAKFLALAGRGLSPARARALLGLVEDLPGRPAGALVDALADCRVGA